METGKSEWVNRVMASGDELQQLQAPDHLYKSILQKMTDEPAPGKLRGINHFRAVLAAASVLVLLNAGIMFSATKHYPKTPPAAYAVDNHNLSFYSNE